MNRQAANARLKTWRAVKDGKLIPEETCSKCGKVPGLGRDGRRLIHAHHHNGYDDEHIFDVIWLCASCHKSCHGNTDWSKHPESKARMIAALTGKELNLTEEEHRRRSKYCSEQKPWKHWENKPECPEGHSDNFGTNNRGHRFCRTCANDNRRVKRAGG